MRSLFLLLVLTVTAMPSAWAETYRVDLIVFRNLWGSAGEQPPKAAKPVDLRGAIDPADTQALQRAGIALVADDQFGLNDEWNRLKSSKQFKPVVRLAWTQVDPPSERGFALLVKAGNKVTVETPGQIGAREANEVEGKVALLMGRFLHLDASMTFLEIVDEAPALWPLDETRRVRRDELHHLDSPRLGILAEVTKVVPQ